MIRTGKLLGLALAVILAGSSVRAASLDIELDDPRIAAGETTALKVKVADASDIKPLKVPSVAGLEISYAGMGRSIEIVNFKKSVSTVFTFHVTAFKPGKYVIPPLLFEIDGKQLSTRTVTLSVSKGLSARKSSPSGRERPVLRTVTEVSSERVYSGEPLVLRYYILSAGTRYNFEAIEKMPETKGFVIKDFDEDRGNDTVALDGVDYFREHVATYILIPTAAGKYTIEGATCIVSLQQEDSFFPFARQTRLYFESKDIGVSEIPAAGAPAGFSGLVGEFSLAADYDSKPVQVYGEKTVTVRVNGTGNLLTMGKPEVSGTAGDVKMISEEGPADLKVTGCGLEGTKSFTFTAIPEHCGEVSLGEFSLSYFNPSTKKFETARSAAVAFTVTGDEKDGPRMDFDESGQKADANPVFIGAIALGLALVVALVVLWERKRYSLVAGKPGQAEPEQKAVPETDRTALRKEMFAAMNSGDAAAFIRAAERALKDFEAEGDEKKIAPVRECRERVYRARFGGASLSRSDMEDIYKIMARLIG
ncbi:MAG TPA: BatD family protein [Spirochaetota bacterium]|nr:BatD family protein [Spirochaetota bacterium]HPI90560.1 BatD family protein [Spirochaetota bacterium]HPR49252.1 BatD family protein [Spirochaetota bacterium]